jgi:hypothetical protein
LPRLLLALTAVAALTAASCSSGNDDGPEVTVGEVEEATVGDLDAVIRPAARQLLDAPGLRVTAAYFSFDNPEQVARFDWLEYRAGGDYLVVYSELEPRRSEAFIQVGNDFYSSEITPQNGRPWSEPGPPPGTPEEIIPALAVLTAMAEQSTTLRVDDSDRAREVTRQQDSEGNTLWTLNNPGIDPDVVTNAAQWFINADGILQFYRVGSEVTPIDGSSGIVYEYAIIADLDRLEPPVPGTSLDLEAIGVPEELRGIEE